jgi:hypothetical protein
MRPTGLFLLFNTGKALCLVFSSILYTSLTLAIKLKEITLLLIRFKAVILRLFLGGVFYRTGIFFTRMAVLYTDFLIEM